LFDATDGNKYFIAEIGSDGRVKCWFEDGNDGDYQKTTVSSFTVDAGVWKHLTFVWDVMSLTAKIFVDGIDQDLSGGTGETATFVGFDTLYFGDNRDASYLTGESSADGLIDEALVFDSVLTPDQIQIIFNNQDAGNNYDGSMRSCPIATIPILEYRFDECRYSGETGDVIDQSGNFDGRSNGILAPENEAIINKTLDLSANGTADWIDVPSTAVDGLDDFSVSVWFKTSVSKSQQEIFHALGSDTDDDELEIFLRNSNTVYIKVRNNSQELDTNTGVVLTDNNWHHLVLTRVDEDVCLFIDGVEQECDNSINSGVLSVTNANAVVIGQEQDSYGGGYDISQNFEGQLDEFKIFDIKLSDSNIDNIYQNELAGNNYDRSPRDIVECEDSCNVSNVTLNAVGIKIGSGGSDSAVNTTTEALAIYDAWVNTGSIETGSINTGSDTYNVTASGSSTVDRIDFGGSTGNFSGTLTYPGVSGSDFLVHTSGTLSLPAGDYTIFVKSDDGFSFIMNTLSGDPVSFSRFGRSNSVGGNELRFETPTGNSRTGGSFTLGQDSVFDIAAIFFERTGGDYLEISIANTIRTNDAPSGYEILRDSALEGKVKFGQCTVPPQVEHYRIEHDTQGFTCEAETMTIKACADTNCDTLFTEQTAITLSPSGWSGSDTLVFTGETTTSLNVTDEGIITLVKTSANPNANLRCFSGSTETCDMTFSDDGFEIYGASIGDPLADQLAARNFTHVNLRAIRSNNNVCEVLLEGPQTVDLTYNCDSPDQCLTPLSGIAINRGGLGSNTGSLTVVFDALGVASLSGLNYPNAGRLSLSVQAEVNGVTISNSNDATVDVYPSYLKLAVEQSELLYGNSGAQNNYIAGKPFTFSIGAYGVNDVFLPNYQAENPQLKVTRIQPASSGSNGSFIYAASGSSSAALAASFTNATGLSFSAGQHQYAATYYDEVGRINIDAKDNTYLGNEIVSSGSLTLGDFYSAYFDVAVSGGPTLADTCGVFSYIGQTVGFDTDPELTVTAYNALDEITENYSDAYWSYLPDEPTLEANLSYMDSSTYTSTGTASEIDLGDAPLVTNNANYDGSGTVTITNGLFQYNKVDTDNTTFDLVSPFSGSIDLVFASDFFATTFPGQAGSTTICYKDNVASGNCKSLTIGNVTGTEMRYGRLELQSTYGPETESLIVPIRAEYYETGQWLLNTDDNCTSAAFDESSDHIQLLQTGSTDITGDIDPISSSGTVLFGVADDSNHMLLNAPGTMGELELQIDPSNDPTGWSDYLNYDWNADGVIDADDYPNAIISFGQYRGNDRIIQWREVFN
jgi:MSHA biogenesis protein MshQ